MIKVLFLLMLLAFKSLAGGLIYIKGHVTKIEKGFVYIQSASGENQIAMKNLSKEQKKDVQNAQGSKKEISLQLLPAALKKED